MRLVIAALVWLAAIAGAAELSTVVSHSIHSSPATASTSAGGSGGSDGSTGPGGSTSRSGGASFDASSVKPTDARSLFRTANFTRVLALVRSHYAAGAKLDMVAVYPGYASLTVVQGGSETDVYVNAIGRFEPTTTGGSPGSSPLFSLARVKASAPAALAHRIATQGHVPESQLNYMVAEINPSNNQFRWLVYPHQGGRVEYFQAAGATGPLLEYRTNSSTGLQPVGG